MFPEPAPLSFASNLIRSLTAAVTAPPEVETFTKTNDCPLRTTV